MKTLINFFCFAKNKIDFNKSSVLLKLLFLIAGFFSLLWFLIRVIPKPQRAFYPCMRATVPFASSFVIYILTLGGSVLFFRRALNLLKDRRLRMGFFILFLSSSFAVFSLLKNHQEVSANTTAHKTFSDPLGPNIPIGEAKGIFPGRVVWVYDADATNINCSNINKSDAFFLDKNTDQAIVDQMFEKGLFSITGKTTHAAAWDTLFRFFNVNHGKGNIGYDNIETIFIKINAVSAWSGAGATGEMPSWSAIEFDTSPQSLLALLRSLINEGKIPQDKIYLGDPMADVWNHVYDKLHAEFPNVKYVSQSNVTPGRYTLTESTTQGIFYSDKGTVMTHTETSNTCYFYQEMMDADYIINVPTMKGHEMGGVTMFAKNYFGANINNRSWALHLGLVYDDIELKGYRDEYKMYRVLVDLMACKNLGGKTLVYFMDGLWSSSWEHQKPQKYKMWPCNNDWSSSLFFSLDPVAIESVGVDIMRNEFSEDDPDSDPPSKTFANYGAVDDYLHQAASSEWWPQGISYDPDNTGSPIGSLGVHEHWNDAMGMQYSRNLNSGNGIELVRLFKGATDVKNICLESIMNIYPNPCNSNTKLHLILKTKYNIIIEVFSINGNRVFVQKINNLTTGQYEIPLNLRDLKKGTYICRVNLGESGVYNEYTQKLIIEQ